MTRALILALAVAVPQAPSAPPSGPSPRASQSSISNATPAPFHWHDDYTEYYLLDPASHQFHIVYYLSQRRAGMTYVLNQTRSGSAGSDISVTDPRTGAPLKFDYMTGTELAAAGVEGRLNPAEHYIRAHLARPVPEGGEGRVRIEKTYKDEKSYVATSETIIFARSLGIGRNAIVLPAGYGLVSSNVAASVATLDDGRIQLSFENVNGYASDVNIRAGKRASDRVGPRRPTLSTARNFNKSLYELQPDGSIRVTHVAAVSGPLSRMYHGVLDQLAGAQIVDLDTGEELPMQIERTARFVSLKTPVAQGHDALVRVTGSLRGQSGGWSAESAEGHLGALSWRHELHEPRATIVLPPGYELTFSRTPVTTGTLPDGRVYLQMVNTREGSPVHLDVGGQKVK